MLVADDSSYAHAMDQLSRFPELVVDLETTGLGPYQGDEMCGIAVKGRSRDASGEAYYLPFRHQHGNIPMQKLHDVVSLIGNRTICGWNLAFDLQFLWKDGMRHDVVIRDAMLDHHLLNENERSFALKTLACSYLRPDANLAERQLEYLLATKLIAGKGNMWMLPPSDVESYACDDVRLTQEMSDFHWPHLQRQELVDVSKGVNRYAVAVAHMIRRGVAVDIDVLTAATKHSRNEMLRLQTEIRERAKRPINLSSPKQVNAWLGVPSSSREALEKIAHRHEDASVLHAYRQHERAIGTYYRKMRDMARDADDGFIHANMKLHGTVSGRLSVSDPPLQSLPRDTSVFAVKEAIVPRPGYSLLQADYSQAEIVMACHYGNETNMADVVSSGRNMHDVVAEETGLPRFAAKTLNFSVIYGIGYRTLAQNLNIREREAQQFLAKYHQRYPGFRRLYKRAEEFAKRMHYITMCSGRRRHYNKGYATPEHKASSNLIQGSVAEVMREAQTELHESLSSYDIHQMLQVHDAAYMEVPIGKEQESAEMVREVMEVPDRFMLPLRVDITAGKNLAAKETY